MSAPDPSQTLGRASQGAITTKNPALAAICRLAHAATIAAAKATTITTFRFVFIAKPYLL